MSRRLLTAASIAFVLGALAILFWPQLIGELILVPFSYLSWLGGLLYRSFDQQVLWVSFIILALILAFLSLKLRRSPLLLTSDQPEPIPPRVRVWQQRLDDAERGKYMQWRFAQYLSDLIIETLAYRAGESVAKIHTRLENDELALPPEIKAYLKAARGFELNAVMSQRIFSSSQSGPLDLPHAALVAFLEELL